MKKKITITNKCLSPDWKEKSGKEKEQQHQQNENALKWWFPKLKLSLWEVLWGCLVLTNLEGILPSPCSLFKFFHAPALSFLCRFPQLAHHATALPLSFASPSPDMGTFLVEGAQLFANKSGVRAFTRRDFLLNTKLHFQQYITAIVQVGLQRIFWGQHPSLHKARPPVIT